jgi:hypothetical protein
MRYGDRLLGIGCLSFLVGLVENSKAFEVVDS